MGFQQVFSTHTAKADQFECQGEADHAASDPQVMLQELSVGMRLFPETHEFVLANIGKATQLTKLEFCVYPSNFRHGEWPLHLPNLRSLQLTRLSCDLPSATTS